VIPQTLETLTDEADININNQESEALSSSTQYLKIQPFFERKHNASQLQMSLVKDVWGNNHC
jgi:hypothetical protein